MHTDLPLSYEMDHLLCHIHNVASPGDVIHFISERSDSKHDGIIVFSAAKTLVLLPSAVAISIFMDIVQYGNPLFLSILPLR